MVGLWHDLTIDLSPIPVKEVTNLYLEQTFLAWMFCFQIRQPRNLPFVSHKLCIHIHVDTRERARAGKVWSEGANGE